MKKAKQTVVHNLYCKDGKSATYNSTWCSEHLPTETACQAFLSMSFLLIVLPIKQFNLTPNIAVIFMQVVCWACYLVLNLNPLKSSCVDFHRLFTPVGTVLLLIVVFYFNAGKYQKNTEVIRL